jgi:hypothetical protein
MKCGAVEANKNRTCAYDNIEKPSAATVRRSTYRHGIETAAWPALVARLRGCFNSCDRPPLVAPNTFFSWQVGDINVLTKF